MKTAVEESEVSLAAVLNVEILQHSLIVVKQYGKMSRWHLLWKMELMVERRLGHFLQGML